jgi:cytidylate kinase
LAIITISRGTLSGGRALAECLGSRLEYPVVGREVLQEAAEAMGFAEETFRGKFETTPGLWGRLTKARKDYVLAVQTVLAERCVEGDLIYHGLSGQHLLKGLPGVFKARLIAPMKTRVMALLETHPMMTPAQAEASIRDVDQDRSRWVKILYDADVHDSSVYDLTLNLETHTIQSACSTIEKALSLARYQVTEEVKAEISVFAAECRNRLDQAVGG